MSIKVVTNESIPEFERRVNELLASGHAIISCGVSSERFWAILEKK